MSEGCERSAERVRVDAFVQVHGSDGQELVFRTRDLSAHGVFLYTRVAHAYPYRIGQSVALELHDFDETVACKGVIVRVVEPNSAESLAYPTGFGVRIVEIDEPNQRALDAMIERVKQSGSVY